MQKKEDKFLRIHSKTIFHQEIQPINAKALQEKTALFKANLKKK